MADTKITALTALTAADPANDVIPIVDVSDTTMAASGTTKKISVNNILSSSPTASGALTVTGLVTAGSATITGALTVDTTTLVVDATNNRVGIGTASPNSYPVAPNLVVETATSGGITIRNSATGYGGLFFADGTGADAYRGYVQYNHDYLGIVDKLLLGVAGADRLTINSTGDVNVVTGNVVMGTSGKGIDFSATTSGSGTMTSELLSDYEEGTFTATLNGSVANPTTTQTATGRYTKVGRQVTVQVFFSSATTTGASGRIQILGLPFANNASVEAISNVAFYSMATFTGIPVGITLASGTSIDMYSSQSGAVYQPVNFNTGVAQSVWVSLTYTV